jgi:hypothetical protein
MRPFTSRGTRIPAAGLRLYLDEVLHPAHQGLEMRRANSSARSRPPGTILYRVGICQYGSLSRDIVWWQLEQHGKQYAEISLPL